MAAPRQTSVTLFLIAILKIAIVLLVFFLIIKLSALVRTNDATFTRAPGGPTECSTVAPAPNPDGNNASSRTHLAGGDDALDADARSAHQVIEALCAFCLYLIEDVVCFHGMLSILNSDSHAVMP